MIKTVLELEGGERHTLTRGGRVTKLNPYLSKEGGDNFP